MAIYQLKTFARFARGEKIPDDKLTEAVERAARGLVDADLGGGLIKQRVARKGQGRSGGYRMMIAFRGADFSVFLLGLAKSDESNVDDRQLIDGAAPFCGFLAFGRRGADQGGC